MAETVERPMAMLNVTTHPDAEIFLIGNDRHVVDRAVGQLKTLQPVGLYRLKVMRTTVAEERLLDLDGHLSLDVELEAPDSAIPFARTLDAAAAQRIGGLESVILGATFVLVCRGKLSKQAKKGRDAPTQFTCRLLPWAANEIDLLADRSSATVRVADEHWTAKGAALDAGAYVLEIDDGSRRSRQILPILPGWQTRVFVRRKPPLFVGGSGEADSAGGDRDRIRPATIDVAIHLSRGELPIAFAREHESTEIVRLALAMGRRIIQSPAVIEVFLGGKFADPIAGVAAAHLMFDQIERDAADIASAANNAPATNFTRKDVTEVIGNLTRLFDVGSVASADLVALKLRAGMRLAKREKRITVPPIYARSWKTLIDAAVGEQPRVELDAELYAECAGSYSIGSYFGWAPIDVREFLAQVLRESRGLVNRLAPVAIGTVAQRFPASSKMVEEIVLETLAYATGNGRTAPVPDEGVARRIEHGDLWNTVSGALTRIGDEAAIGLTEGPTPAFVSRIVQSIGDRFGVTQPQLAKAMRVARGEAVAWAEGIISIFDDHEQRHKLADKFGVPRSVFDALLPAPQKRIESAAVESEDLRDGTGVVPFAELETLAFTAVKDRPEASVIDIGAVLTADRLRRVCPNVRADILETIISSGPDVLGDADFINHTRIAHFIAQCAAETGGLRRLDEDLYYTTAARLVAVFPSKFPTEASARPFLRNPEKLANHVYANRNGNSQPGDGWRYRGSGLIQLTGRGNFKSVGDLIGMDLVGQPDLVREVDSALAIAVGYWSKRDINAVADGTTDSAVEAVTRRINPALVGLADRKRYFRAALRAFAPPTPAVAVAEAFQYAPPAVGTARATKRAAATGKAAPRGLAAASVGAGELSGPQWTARFPTSREIDDLAAPFSAKVAGFVAAMRTAGANVRISATYRPKERAYLMHWAWKIGKQGYDPADVPPMPGVPIIWQHPTQARSRRAARDMVEAYGMVQIAALNSRHTEKKAIDMTITWSGALSIAEQDGGTKRIATSPRNGSNALLIDVGAGYGVIKLRSDPPHWSDDGR